MQNSLLDLKKAKNICFHVHNFSLRHIFYKLTLNLIILHQHIVQNIFFSFSSRDYQAGIDFRPLRATDPVETHQITVCVRKRPLGKKGK